jgi:hypothetical protein
MLLIILKPTIAHIAFGVVRGRKVMVLERLGSLELAFTGVTTKLWVDQSDMLLNQR